MQSLKMLVRIALVVAASFARAGDPAPAVGDEVARGRYLVTTSGCHDCHTPMKLGANGPEWDMSRALSGHPEDAPALPPANLPPGYMAAIGGTFTSFSGPWGTSFTRNLTPDKETGLGDWTVEEFIATMKTGRERGKGRPVLPPMPWTMIGQLTDNDLKDVFAYLQSLPPVKNRVPAPVDPTER